MSLENETHNRTIAKALAQRVERIATGGSKRAREKFLKEGKKAP